MRPRLNAISQALKWTTFLSLAIHMSPTTSQAFPQRIIDVRPIMRIQVSPTERAEKLALAGERLFTSYSFMYADEVFDLAVQYDPHNQRAQFYKHIIEILKPAKGILARVAPLAKGYTSKAKSGYEKTKMIYSENPNLKAYFVEGPADITTEKQLQDVAGASHKALNEFRIFIKKNKSRSLTLKLNVPSEIPLGLKYGQLLSQKAGFSLILANTDKIRKECSAKKVAQNLYEMTACAPLETTELIVERVDYDLLQSEIAATLVSTSLLTAYDLTGYISINQKSKRQTLSDKNYVAYLKKIPAFGKLKQPQQLRLIKSLGVDSLIAYKWMMRNQQKSCPANLEDAQWDPVYGGFRLNGQVYYSYNDIPQRPGTLYPTGGACVSSYTMDNPTMTDYEGKEAKLLTLPQLLLGVKHILSGGTTSLYGYSQSPTMFDESNYTEIANPNAQEYQTTVKWMALLTKPVADLKTLMPTKFNNCGHRTNFGDETLGGTFVRGDASQFLSKTRNMGDSKCDK